MSLVSLHKQQSCSFVITVFVEALGYVQHQVRLFTASILVLTSVALRVVEVLGLLLVLHSLRIQVLPPLVISLSKDSFRRLLEEHFDFDQAVGDDFG